MKNFKNFAVALFTNRLGIVLAAINACFFAAGLLSKFPFGATGLERIIFAQNTPAMIATALFSYAAHFLFSASPFSFRIGFMKSGVVFFVVLQWLFVAWAAKVIARKLRKAR